MKKVFLLLASWLFFSANRAQTINQKLQNAFQQFETDSQMKHAISSIYVINAETGEVVFDKNSKIGLADASTQKIFTAITAFELLGKNFRYKTEVGMIKKDVTTSLYLAPSGDPTFGSWRWSFTKEDMILTNITKALNSRKINYFNTVTLNYNGWSTQLTPDGWIWQDIGNYYGAGAGILNWRENQFDMILMSGKKIGDSVKIIKTIPKLYNYPISSLATSAVKGSGDNAYIYFPESENTGIVRGTIPVNENNFKISGSFRSPVYQFIETLKESVTKSRIKFSQNTPVVTIDNINTKPEIVYTHYSPSLDSIIYWFLKKSINLYGEALLKAIAIQQLGIASTDSGVSIVKRFWKEKGVDENELNMYDGSGLSPLNRITTHAQAVVLKYAKSKDWFPYFYDALPDFNGMKMKSGTISDVKGFCGYQQSKEGKEYIFSFLVNNYNGKAGGVISKMYKVLDLLK